MTVYYFILLFVLGAGAWFDFQEHRIPNWWIGFGVGLGLILSFFNLGIPVSALDSLFTSLGFLFRFIVVIAFFFILFVFRMIGAGDIKLAAIICGYLGFKAGGMAVFLSFLFGAFWSLLKMVRRGSFSERFFFLYSYIRNTFQTGKITAYYDSDRDGYDPVIPLGVCLFWGTLVVVCFSNMRGVRF